MLKSRFETNKPKEIVLKDDRCPVVIFIDGSFEPGDDNDVAMVGGVMLDGQEEPQVFGCHVPKVLLDGWKSSGKEHLIGQVELYAVAVARCLWRKELANRRVLLFTEKTWRDILLCIEQIDEQYPCYIWAAGAYLMNSVAFKLR